MGAWLDLLEFLDRCPEARSIAERRLGSDDGPAIDELLGQAIEDAESRIRTRLLKRFSVEQLPTEPAHATDTLKRLTAEYAWWQLHRKFELLSDSVERIGAAVLSELNDLIAGGKVELIRVGQVSAPSSRTFVRSTTRGPRAVRPLTLDDLSDWGP